MVVILSKNTISSISGSVSEETSGGSAIIS